MAEPGSSDTPPPPWPYKRAPGQPICNYGTGCYRKNPDHFAQYDHPAEHPLPPAPCNGTYAFSREHEGRPLYKKEGGAAIIYFKKDWPALRRIFTDEISMATSSFVL